MEALVVAAVVGVGVDVGGRVYSIVVSLSWNHRCRRGGRSRGRSQEGEKRVWKEAGLYDDGSRERQKRV